MLGVFHTVQALSLLCPGFVRTERLREQAQAAVGALLEAFGQDSDEVTRLAFDSLADGLCAIPTNPASREFALEFHRELTDTVHKLLPQ